MPVYIPIPEGMQPPAEEQFELPVTFEVRDGMLYALAVDGQPIPAEGEAEGGEEAEMEDADFMQPLKLQWPNPQHAEHENYRTRCTYYRGSCRQRGDRTAKRAGS